MDIGERERGREALELPGSRRAGPQEVVGVTVEDDHLCGQKQIHSVLFLHCWIYSSQTAVCESKGTSVLTK